jgi:hypothetical protein
MRRRSNPYQHVFSATAPEEHILLERKKKPSKMLTSYTPAQINQEYADLIRDHTTRVTVVIV